MTLEQKNKGLEILRYSLTTFLLLASATGVSWLFWCVNFPETNIILLYLLSILLIARLTRGFTYGLAASIVAILAFNFFFIEPRFAFHAYNSTYVISFIIMVITAFITGALASRDKQHAKAAREKEAETSAIFTLTNRLTDAADMPQIASITVSTISDIMDCHAALLCYDDKGEPEGSFIQQLDNKVQIRREVRDLEDMKYKIESLRTGYAISDEFYDWPIYGKESILGVLGIPKEVASVMSETKLRLLRSMIESVSLAMDRLRIIKERMNSKEEAVQERYRGNLLRAISHDLRTPLSGIMGTSEMIMDMSDPDDQRYTLAKGIHKDADWLHALVENILSLTRLQDSKLALTKEMGAVEEVVGSAVRHITKRYPGYEISVHIPEEPLFLPMDGKLVLQMLINLLDNAVKHTPPGKEITVTVRRDDEKKEAVFSVADEGRGIPPADLPNVFQMFYTTHSREPDAQRGVGLGLAICETIAKAHGGSIKAQNRTNGQGAEFIFTLPMERGKDKKEEREERGERYEGDGNGKENRNHTGG